MASLPTTLPFYQVDAFADGVFTGNPAAVVPLEGWLPDAVLQAIAEENNLSETAFFLADRDPAPLRWFTPRQEVPLCGHATLAAGWVVLHRLASRQDTVTFETRSGLLRVTRDAEDLALDFPVVAAAPCDPPRELATALGVEPQVVLSSSVDPNYFVILADEETVRSVSPDLPTLARLHPHGVAVSAAGTSADFVSRYFAPSYGIPEDPVTGSIHCALAPYWANRLGRSTLSARQLSRRGGALSVEVAGQRVRLRGRAACYLEGRILLPDSG